MTEQAQTSSLIRLIGVMAIGVGAAWALQVLGFGGSTAVGKTLWVLGSALIAGAGAGLIYTSMSLRTSAIAPKNWRLPA